MTFNVFKNTVLLFVLVMISCASKSEKKSTKQDEILKQVKNDSSIIVGANQVDMYLPLLNGKRVGIVANQTSVIKTIKKTSGLKKKVESGIEITYINYTHLVDSLLSLNVNISKVFAPEHGFRGKADAGELIDDSKDTKTGLPIISLHGKNKKPTQEQLKNIDIIIFDIQDVGVRFYTYISTLHYVMEACAEANIPVIILDRPNPNAHYIDGPMMETQHTSFLGLHPVPLVYGMTIGEYAHMINGEQWLENKVKCDITVIPIKHYTHERFYSLPTRPSPNLPNDKSIELYPSLGLFEGTNINAGRGTEFQFQRYGAPFLNERVFSFSYTPIENFGAKYPKHKEKYCFGEDLKNETINDEITLKWLIKAYNNSTDKSLVFNTDNFTIHAGTKKLQQQIEAGLTEAEIKKTWQKGLNNFKKTRAKYLLYE